MNATPTTRTLVTHNPAETHDLGSRLGAAALPGLVIALHGDLGAGKTTLTQGIAAGLGITARVTSPTFTLVSEYAGTRLRLIHIDTYRLGDAPAAALAEAGTFGLAEILETAGEPDNGLAGAIVVIEWAERVASALPADTLTVDLRPTDGDQMRAVTLHAVAGAGLAAISAL
jgi:tRNA threonylcarbamoyladenosine biosynthesis protein TsaE